MVKNNINYNIGVVGLGSNIQPQENIIKTKDTFSKCFNIKKLSRFKMTEPIGLLDQPPFLNGCILFETPLDQCETITIFKKIEKQLGRVKNSIKFGPRCIDLDLIVWNNVIIDPDFYTRHFIRDAVLELLPQIPMKRT